MDYETYLNTAKYILSDKVYFTSNINPAYKYTINAYTKSTAISLT